MNVGVLALQGDVPEHLRALAELVGPGGVRPVYRPSDLEGLEALFLPGGESTTIGRLLAESSLREPLKARIDSGFPVLATCAGLVLLSREIEPSPGGRDPESLGGLDVRVRRNDYGRQRESFEAALTVTGVTGPPFPGVFIRSPRIVEVGPRATPIAWRGTEVVGVGTGQVWGLAFHPELAGDPRVHKAFLAEVRGAQASARARSTRA